MHTFQRVGQLLSQFTELGIHGFKIMPCLPLFFVSQLQRILHSHFLLEHEIETPLQIVALPSRLLQLKFKQLVPVMLSLRFKHLVSLFQVIVLLLQGAS